MYFDNLIIKVFALIYWVFKGFSVHIIELTVQNKVVILNSGMRHYQIDGYPQNWFESRPSSQAMGGLFLCICTKSYKTAAQDISYAAWYLIYLYENYIS